MLLAIESSCDESSAALVEDGRCVDVITSSQIDAHTAYGGVVPELATREHLKNLPPITRQLLHRCGVSPSDLDAVAATQGPGLPQALLAGLQFGQGIAAANNLAFIPAHHHEAHLFSPWMDGEPLGWDFTSIPPFLGLIVSGGHTLLVERQEGFHYRVVGGTIDDAAGECFDKAGKMLGLPYPAGPAIDRLAAQGNPARVRFPRPMMNKPGFDFSFSGLKTSVRVFLEKNPEWLRSKDDLADICASIQAAIVEVLVAKTVKAAVSCGQRNVAVSGGVALNRGLRNQMAAACDAAGLVCRFAAPSLCGDNALMIGALAEAKWTSGCAGSLDYGWEPRPSWELD